MAVGGGLLPARLPVYLIERLGAGPGTVYRITAAGFGSRAATVVVLQAWYRRSAAGGGAPPAGRIGWREIANWPELHALAAH
jgi:type IV pilus assembly protein PilX